MSSLPPWLTSLARQVASGLGQALSSRGRGKTGGQGTGTSQPKTRRTAPKKPRAGSGPSLRPPSSGQSQPTSQQQIPVPHDLDYSPGKLGPEATVEVDPRQVGPVRMTYQPDRDGDPDPGEIVWTWVPFEENDGRGKDRPVLVVAVETGGTVLAVQLTSKDHDGESDFMPIGAGSWDGEHRPSWVNIDRVMRVHPLGMRREAAALDSKNYARVEAALRQRYGWS